MRVGRTLGSCREYDDPARSERVFVCVFFFFFQAEDGIRDLTVTGVQTCALPILFDFTGDVYGASVTVAWARRLRDTQTFPSRQALVDQIERDAIAARAVLKEIGRASCRERV